jgi:hypothetical protein
MANTSSTVRAHALLFAGAALAVGLLAGCTAAPSASGPSDSTSSDAGSSGTSTDSPATSSTPKPPAAFRADGTALQNEAFFKSTVRAVLQKNHDSGGKPIVDALVKAGFAKKTLEVTPDKTSVGLDADNIEFSAKVNGGCIIGQSGNVGFSVITAPLLSTGRCLIGKTRTIDW